MNEHQDLQDDSPDFVSGKEGDEIFREGDQSADLYIIQHGQIALTRQVAGDVCQLEVLSIGDSIGELSMFDGGPRDVTARALTSYKLLRISRATFDRVIREDVGIATQLLRNLAYRLQQYQLRIRTRQLVLFERSSQTVFPLAQSPELTIGRRNRLTGFIPDLDLTAVDMHKSVSRGVHARIVQRDARVYVKASRSTNRTIVRGNRITADEEMEVAEGDCICFGDVELILKVRQ